MADPQTFNTGLFVPTRGSDVGVWDIPVNGDFSAIDGFLGGVQTVSAAGASPITLSSPAGFTPVPSPGPTQSQNGVIRFTGALTGNVQITLPLPGYSIIENLTTGAFVLSFRAIGAGQVIAIDQGVCQHVYNDGANVRFVNMGKVGDMEFWAGVTAIPPWVSACTIPPYLLCDGTATYSFATYPYLGNKFKANFGGNGVTTFGVPDTQGRVPLAYDGTGSRITTAGCGINGQTLGAAGGVQNITMQRSDLPNASVSVNIHDSGHNHSLPASFYTDPSNAPQGGSGGGTNLKTNFSGTAFTGITADFQLNGNVTQTTQSNVQPAQVAGIWVVRAA